MDDVFHSQVPLYGWRAWRLEWEHDQPILHGQRALYRSRTLTAVCTPDQTSQQRIGRAEQMAGHTPPGRDCSCGIYAVRKPSDLITEVGYLPDVFGIVSLWGDVEEHEHAYRAEKATMQRLWIIVERDGWANFTAHLKRSTEAALHHRYEVPVGQLHRDQLGPNTFDGLVDTLAQHAFHHMIGQGEVR